MHVHGGPSLSELGEVISTSEDQSLLMSNRSSWSVTGKFAAFDLMLSDLAVVIDTDSRIMQFLRGQNSLGGLSGEASLSSDKLV